MKCINCGVNLNEGATYCIRCGSFQNGVPSENNSSNVISAQQNQSINYDILVQAYVGEKYNNFKYGRFSWMYFFFGPFYGFCRRMYSFGLINFLALWLCTFAGFIGEWFELICGLIINLYFCFKFKSSYLETATKRVNKIVLDNPNLDMVMLQEKCRKKGGLNIFWVIMLIVLPILIFVSIFILAFSSTSNLVDSTRYRTVESDAKYYLEAISTCTILEYNIDDAIKNCDELGIKEYLSDRLLETNVSFELTKDINTNKIIVKSFKYTEGEYTIELVDSYKSTNKKEGQFVSKKRDIDSIILALSNVVWKK